MARNELFSYSFMLMSFAMAALLLTVEVDNQTGNAPAEPLAAQVPAASATNQLPSLADPTPILAPILAVVAQFTPPQLATPHPLANLSSSPALPPGGDEPVRAVVQSAITSSLVAFVSSHATEAVWLKVDLSDRQVTVYRGDKQTTTYPIGIGQPGWETPTGTFHITMMEENPVWQHPITGQLVPAGPDNPLGSRWIGFWSTKDYEIGFHGTNRPELVGQAVSHGCLRMHDGDVRKLFTQVGVGTLVRVQP